LNRLTQRDCQSPGEKAAALVVAHHVLVDGLSKLPPIKLKPEQEISAPRKSPQAPGRLHMEVSMCTCLLREPSNFNV
jgi:hypothetical protein